MLVLMLIVTIAAEPNATIIELVERTNIYRSQQRLAAVTIDAKLCKFAQNHAEWMAKTGNYQHSNPAVYAEIIHYTPTTAKKAIQDWINSPGHRSIMVGRYTRCGYGYANINGRRMWCGVFR